MERKIRVGAVSYLNTKPLLHGIQHAPVMDEMVLKIDYPARISQWLLQDEIDIGLVPVAVIPKLREFHINTEYCIGSDGPVASVCLFGESPVEKLTKVLLDYQSQTSVKLAAILLRNHWKVSPELMDAGREFIGEIQGTIGGVVIGDRALKQRKISRFQYDLGLAWKEMTGLPFVYAAWISNKPLDPGFIGRFNEANAAGLAKMDEVIAGTDFPEYDLSVYFHENMSYALTAEKMKGLKLFLDMMGNAR